MAIFYEIHASGFADKLMSGIVVTGGSAQIANLGNLIYEISGYRTRTGYPRHLFSYQGCEGVTDTSAATSIGLVMAAKNDRTLNCAFNAEGYVPVSEVILTGPEEENPEVKEPEEDEKPKETLLDFEPVEVTEEEKKKKKEKKPTIKWKNPFTKFGEFCGSIYDTVQKDINDEN